MYYKEKREKTCPMCATVFHTLDVHIKYCSPKCAIAGKKKKQEHRHQKYEQHNILKFGIRETTSTKLSFLCKHCGEKFTRYTSQVQKRGAGYCSVECRAKGSIKEKPTDTLLIGLWAEVVKLYDQGKCAYCGKTAYLNAHHIFSRSNHSTRYDLENGITLCASHHTLSSQFSAHKTPVEFVEWIKERRGEEWYQSLRQRAHQTLHYSTDELMAIKGNFLDVKSHFVEEKLNIVQST